MCSVILILYIWHLSCVFFFRFWSPCVWGLFPCTSHWSIGCIPWKISLENRAVIFCSSWGLWELLQFNFNLFSWLPFATFAFYMMIFYSDSVWVLKWVYIFFSCIFIAHSLIRIFEISKVSTREVENTQNKYHCCTWLRILVRKAENWA